MLRRRSISRKNTVCHFNYSRDGHACVEGQQTIIKIRVNSRNLLVLIKLKKKIDQKVERNSRKCNQYLLKEDCDCLTIKYYCTICSFIYIFFKTLLSTRRRRIHNLQSCLRTREPARWGDEDLIAGERGTGSNMPLPNLEDNAALKDLPMLFWDIVERIMLPSDRYFLNKK